MICIAKNLKAIGKMPKFINSTCKQTFTPRYTFKTIKRSS